MGQRKQVVVEIKMEGRALDEDLSCDGKQGLTLAMCPLARTHF